MSADGPRPGQVWSAAPPGAGAAMPEVMVAGVAAPGTAGATRATHLKRLLNSRRYAWALALGCGGTFLAAAAADHLLIAALAPVGVAVATLIMADTSARRLAAADFFTGFARRHDFTYTDSLELLEATPLLGAGDRRRCEHYMEGALSPDLPGVRVGMAHYTYEVSSERTDRRGRTIESWTPYRFTICVVDLQNAIGSFPGVFLSRRRGLLGRIGGDTWLDYHRMRPVELESSTLASKYELYVRRSQDDTRLLELFKPSFQVWLSELPVELCFEYSGGTLVTYLYKHAGDATSLEILLASTASIAERILREGEPLSVVEQPSVAPPPHSVSPPPQPPPTAG
jgi:hypothetical protein